MKRVLTGIKPTGPIHIGSYLGFVKQLLQYQKDYEVYLMIADFHAQTVPYKPEELRRTTFDLAASFLALGMDPGKVVLFRQSDVPEHAQLYWILGCLTSVGDLYRMVQFKEMGKEYGGRGGVNAGILMYPVLQAADVLLYQPDFVPVGKDQKQHLELTREVARRFNRRFGETFKIPHAVVQKETEKIMSLDDPSKKMSKSKPAGMLGIFEPEAVVRGKIRSAVTDSGKEMRYHPRSKPAVSNLIVIYKQLSGKSFSKIEKEFAGRGYGEFKENLARLFLSYFRTARERKERSKKQAIEEVFAKGAERAGEIAADTLGRVLMVTGLR